jgi:serine/threonine-protein kinase
VGSGGYGTIYYALTPDNQPVAVKVLESGLAQRDRDRFEREFEKLRQATDHPGIVRCFEFQVSEADDHEYPWFSMEYATGGDLAQRIAQRQQRAGTRAPWDDPALRQEVVREFRAVVAAVAHLHENLNLVHRDIKPSNVLVMEDGSLRLSDFGIIKSLEPSLKTLRLATSRGQVMGTPEYMAPEQRDGEALRPADVYSLGILLAELAVGERPIPEPDVPDGTTLVAWPALRRLPGPLAKLIKECTAFYPADRPQDGGALLDSFEDVLRRLGTSP